MLDFFRSKRHEEDHSEIDFVPSIQINPNSNIFLECSPNDPHTSSNIIVNSYQSKTNRALLQTRIHWSRFKFITETQQSVEELPFVTGNAYRCEPADLGSYIRAKVTSFDISSSGSGEVTIGPIRLDPTIKALVDGALYSKSHRSQVKLLEKHQFRNASLILSDKTIKFVEENSQSKLQMEYDMYEPKLELNPKDPTKIFLRFERDESNSVRRWLDSIFNEGGEQGETESYRSKNSSSSKSKIFKNSNCVNKVEVNFLTRHCRDQFIFSLRAFICKESMRSELVMQTIENVQQMKNPADTHKFFQFLSLKMESYRLYGLIRELEADRNQKVRDITDLEESIGEMTLTYTKIIEEKGRLANVDFNQSYSEISIRREEILGKKQMRELQHENEQLKLRLREMNEELELKEFFRRENNESMLFNQTNNPFAKKGQGDSIYHTMNEDEREMPKGNMLELTKSYMNLVKENEKLKNERLSPSNHSRDMMDLLESLHEEDEDPVSMVKRLKDENQKLQAQVNELQADAIRRGKNQPSIRLNQSVAHQQSMMSNKSYLNQSQLEKSRDGASFYSAVSNLNDSQMTESGILLMLEKKIKEIEQINKQTSKENNRLRRERDECLLKIEELKRSKAVDNSRSNLQNSGLHDMTSSYIFDRETFNHLRQEKEALQNENKKLTNKIQSLINEAAKDSPLLVQSNEQLQKENNLLKQENSELRKEIESLRISSDRMKTRSSDGSTQNIKENDKLKKINVQLLEEIKNLKRELENKADPLYSSRVVELQNEVNFLKNKGDNGAQYDQATQQLLAEVSKLQKENENLKRLVSDKDSKLQSQATLIERLMNSHEEGSQSVSGKDKSYSESHNEAESTEKLKKKIRDLQEEIVLMRRSADALNRSKDISMEMQQYNQEQLEVVRREKEMLLEENERLSKMCEKYAKDAREAVKWKKQALDLMKAQKGEAELEKDEGVKF